MGIKYKKGYKYQLHEEYQIRIGSFSDKDCVSFAGWVENDVETAYLKLTKEGMLIVKKGYAWDGASGPTVDSRSSMRGSLVHDALYQLIRLKLIDKRYRYEADMLFKKIVIEDGMWEWRASAWFKAVRNFAWYAAMPAHEPKVHEAP